MTTSSATTARSRDDGNPQDFLTANVIGNNTNPTRRHARRRRRRRQDPRRNRADGLYGGNSVGSLVTPFDDSLGAEATSAAAFGTARFDVLLGGSGAGSDRDRILGDNGVSRPPGAAVLPADDRRDPRGRGGRDHGQRRREHHPGGRWVDTVDAAAATTSSSATMASWTGRRATARRRALDSAIDPSIGGTDQITGGTATRS